MNKTLNGNSKALVTVMVDKEVKTERLLHLEDNLNPAIVFRVQGSKSKWTNCIALYRQWNDPLDGQIDETELIKKQVNRLKSLITVITNVVNEDPMVDNKAKLLLNSF